LQPVEHAHIAVFVEDTLEVEVDGTAADAGEDRDIVADAEEDIVDVGIAGVDAEVQGERSTHYYCTLRHSQSHYHSMQVELL